MVCIWWLSVPEELSSTSAEAHCIVRSGYNAGIHPFTGIDQQQRSWMVGLWLDTELAPPPGWSRRGEWPPGLCMSSTAGTAAMGSTTGWNLRGVAGILSVASWLVYWGTVGTATVQQHAGIRVGSVLVVCTTGTVQVLSVAYWGSCCLA